MYELRTLFWETTLRCNAFCEFCGSRCGENKTEELDTEDIKKVFQRVASEYNPQKIMINVTGGEPLLRQDLYEVMEYATGLGFSWGMVTNGTLLTADTVQRLKASGMKTISVSIDGMEETHNKIRGINDGWKKSIDGIKLLAKESFLDCIQVTTVVSKKNIDELDELYSLLLSLKIDSWRIAVVDPIGRAEDNKEILLDSDCLQRYMDFIKTKQWECKEMEIVSTCSHYFGKRDFEFHEHGFSCHTGINVASILSNGDIFVCPNVPRRPELIQGNVLTDDFVECWENRFQYFRNPQRCREGKCSSCSEYEFCKGDSLHSWDFENKSPKFCYKDYIEEKDNKSLQEITDFYLKKCPRLSGYNLRYHNINRNRLVVFTPYATDKILSYFDWGQNSPFNLSELMVSLVGYSIFGDDSGQYTQIVEQISPVFLEERGEANATFSGDSLKCAMQELETLNSTKHLADDVLCEKPYELLGFAHSHPDELETYMSEPDYILHKRLLDSVSENVATMILNPQKRYISIYTGDKPQLTDLLLLGDEEHLKYWELYNTLGGFV